MGSICYPLIILFICCAPLIQGGVIANFSILFDYVSTDEIVVLQNAIEDVGLIDQMRVKAIAFESPDVPPAPVNVTATANSSTAILVTWEPVNVTIHGNLTVIGYAVYFKRYRDAPDSWNKVTVTSIHNSVLVKNLDPFTLYTFRALAFHAGGNGITSPYVDEKTMEGVPSEPPRHFECSPASPTEITLSWNFLESTKWNGYEKAYTIHYRVYRSYGSFTEKIFQSSERTGVLSDLKQHTRYEIFIMATTNKGLGPRSWCSEITEEGVPSVGPEITSYSLDPNRALEAIITWDPIPEDKINGNLIGYKFYYGTSKVGKDAVEYPEMKSVKLDKFTNRYVIKGLQVYTEIKIVIHGMTSVGEGTPSDARFFATCKCPQQIYAAWFENKPYVSVDNDGNVGGIFPKYLNGMVDFLCVSCSTGSSSKLYWDRSKTGHSPKRTDEKNLKEMVEDNVHLHVAMFGRSELETFQSDYKYVPIVASPGIAFIVRDPLAELDRTAAIMTSLAGCWPAIIIIFVFSMVAGIFIWITDCKANEEDFPGESFIKGMYHGTYWAFVSMTTVGYGDKTPRSFKAQVVAIVWMLMGPIVNGIVVGAITTSLTTINLESDPKIYGTSVAAIANTFEYNLGVRRNAKMNVTGRAFKTKEEMVEALKNRIVDGILLDSLVAADMAFQLGEKNLKISKVIPEPSGWGVIISSDLVRLEDEIRSYVKLNEQMVKEMVENATDGKLTIKSKAPSSLDTGIVDPESQAFKDFVLYGLIAYVILCIIGLTFEHGFLRMRKKRIIPYSQEHRSLLENNLAKIVTEFCDELSELINTKSTHHESELKRLFWKKGYSFGVDGWLREKTKNEEQLKNKIRYHEIMSKDLGLYSKKSSSFDSHNKWKKGKRVVSNVLHIAPIRVAPAKDNQESVA